VYSNCFEKGAILVSMGLQQSIFQTLAFPLSFDAALAKVRYVKVIPSPPQIPADAVTECAGFRLELVYQFWVGQIVHVRQRPFRTNTAIDGDVTERHALNFSGGPLARVPAHNRRS
jgi:hypothetical protein